jgi:hypothetical protein
MKKFLSYISLFCAALFALAHDSIEFLEQARAVPSNIDTLVGSIFFGQQGGSRRGGSRTVLFGPMPLDTKIAQSRRDETVFGVRGVAGSVTHLDALLSQRLALLHSQISPVRLYLLEML